jgi:hypothetical protein
MPLILISRSPEAAAAGLRILDGERPHAAWRECG